MPLLPSPPYSSLCSKSERAFYDYIANNQVALPKAAIFTGHDSDEKVCPRVEISAHGGPEEPRATGNFFIQVMITVVGSVDLTDEDGNQIPAGGPTPEAQHATNVATVFDILASHVMHNWLNRVVAEFYVFNYRQLDLGHTVEGRTYRDMIVLEVYCCAARVIPQFPLGGDGPVESPPEVS